MADIKSLKMSRRLHMIADMVTSGYSVADIGTDHGYIPIYQVINGRAPFALACDLNEGPLARARDNVALYGLEDKIRLICSDGLLGIDEPVDSVVIAGMGGLLIKRILSDGWEKIKSVKELVLSPHSEISQLRRYLYEEGFFIQDEDMVFEDGKYYVVMKAVKGEGDEPDELGFLYGPRLLETKNKVLLEHLEKEKDTCEKIIANLTENAGSAKEEKLTDFNAKLGVILSAILRCSEV